MIPSFLLTPFRSYLPLITVIVISGLMSLVQSNALNMLWMTHSMGYFLVLLSMLKIFNLESFRKGFRKYDIITQTFPVYGFAYPFLELSLGLLYLSGRFPVFTNIATIIIMGAGGIGVLNAIRKKQKLNCACMGNILSVPLSTVSVIENFGMSLMALLMLIKHYN